MKSLQDYITEAESWIDTPVVGDEFAINLQEECLVETYVVDVNRRGVVLQGDDQLIKILESYGAKLEDIKRYGAVGTNRAQGFTLEGTAPLGECDDEGSKSGSSGFDEFLSLLRRRAGLPENANSNDPLLAKSIDDAAVPAMEDPTQEEPTAGTQPISNDGPKDEVGGVSEGVMSEIDIELQNIAQSEDMDRLIDGIRGELGSKVAQYLNHEIENIQDELSSKGMDDVVDDAEQVLEILMDRIIDNYDAADFDLDEAEYRGRKVALNKPMQGDVAKFKVYVKDPSTGNVKKVNFGDKTMRIKKSNPARRRSFRARHRCENPGPKTKARYWSCRKW